ncbi:uncharacterized protein GGS25DRAFT_501794 [Hypoxylon fragiforme]|uniref:uncharacterized protein n=1 Tax=Hypoxylon fragiforme TaxID=63214 RepID=UPI0020C6161D|nr:uncharacterized protein GGS25DRAFT_501794 [Hypoxylon fragiforme]KAI2604729.1 hypothetical protein GGS25DRAFT_501794 [Hypoxylon fragiforme]
MRPLILHNVPDEELYTGDDGIQRPYAMYWPDGERQRNLPRTRAREITESGSFGKSTRRSRSRTGSAPPKREDATMQSADKIFSNYLANRQQAPNANATTTSTQRKSSFPTQTTAQSQDDASSAAQTSTYRKEPTEIILRGYSTPSQQYAAINHYEHIAGRICEDYSREPPIEARRYKSDLRDPALTRRQPLTVLERAKVSRVASGEHWVKVTFESAEAADAALYASPQKILGHLIYAEHYLGLPPKEDAAMLNVVGDSGMVDPFRSNYVRARAGPSQPRTDKNARLQKPFSSFDPSAIQQDSPPGSQGSTQTMDSATASTATVTGVFSEAPRNAERQNKQQQDQDDTYCRRIPEARRVKLLPADQALAPQPTFQQRILAWIPLIGWFGGSMIGNEVPRNELGEFDFNRASLYWQLMFYLDLWFGLFSRELVSGDKDE